MYIQHAVIGLLNISVNLYMYTVQLLIISLHLYLMHVVIISNKLYICCAGGGCGWITGISFINKSDVLTVF